MIKYALACEYAHEFEGWFGSSADYDAQEKDGQVECPACGSRHVRKQIMAPAVATTGALRAAPDRRAQREIREVLGRIRRTVEETFDYVGDTFAKTAREIHEGASEERPIYGEATAQEVRSLIEDGVPVAPLPPKLPAKDEIN